MNKPEIVVLSINLGIIVFAYFFIYPKYAKKDMRKMSMFDLILSLLSLVIAGFLFWGQGIKFNAILFNLNWFWFSLLTYFLIEAPFIYGYYKKYDVHPFSD